MLVISRKIGESFVIGDDIEVTVLDITGDKVVLGIVAPGHVPVTRCDAATGACGINAYRYGRQYKIRNTPSKEN